VKTQNNDEHEDKDGCHGDVVVDVNYYYNNGLQLDRRALFER